MAKQRIDLIFCKGTIINLQSFEEVDALNETVRKYKDMIAEMKLRKDLKKNLTNILEYLKRHSCKYPGVSFKGKRKIAADLEMTDKTITRICARLEELGFIKQYEMKRHSDMRQTCNAIVIQPAKIESVSQEPEKMSDYENNISLKQKPYLHNTYPSGHVPATPYAMSKQFVNNFVNDPKLTNKLYGIYLAQTSYIRDIYDSGELFNIGLQAIKETFQASKRKRLRNITGYYHGTICRMYDRYQHEERFASYYAE